MSEKDRAHARGGLICQAQASRSVVSEPMSEPRRVRPRDAPIGPGRSERASPSHGYSPSEAAHRSGRPASMHHLDAPRRAQRARHVGALPQTEIEESDLGARCALGCERRAAREWEGVTQPRTRARSGELESARARGGQGAHPCSSGVAAGAPPWVALVACCVPRRPALALPQL